MSFIPGYLASISVDGQALNIWSSDATLNKTTNAIPKTTLGLTDEVYINGMKDKSMDVSMHLDTAALVALQVADDSTVPVACVFRPGALGANDAGSYAGDGIITDLTLNGSVDDNWSVDISVQGTGPWPFTQPV